MRFCTAQELRITAAHGRSWRVLTKPGAAGMKIHVIVIAS
jgi:hypothetical protein